MNNRIQFDGNGENEFLKFVNYSINQFSDQEHNFIKKIKISDNKLYNQNQIISTVAILEYFLQILEDKVQLMKQHKKEF